MFKKIFYNFIFLLNFFFIFSSIKTFTFFKCFKKSSVAPEKTTLDNPKDSQALPEKITKKFLPAISLYLSEFGKKIAELSTEKIIISFKTSKNGEFTVLEYSNNNGYGPYFTQIIRTIDNKVILDNLKHVDYIIFSASQDYIFILYPTSKSDYNLKTIKNGELRKTKDGQLIQSFTNISEIQASEIEDIFIIKKNITSYLNEFESEVIKIKNGKIDCPIKTIKTKKIKFLKNHNLIFTHYISKNTSHKELIETKTFKKICDFNKNFNYLKFSKNGTFFVLEYQESQYGLFETNSKKPLFTITSNSLKCKFCPMQRYIFFIDSNNKGQMFDLHSCKILWTTDDVNYFKFSPSGKNIIVKGSTKKNEMRDSETGQIIWENTSDISHAFFSKKNNYLLLISFSGSLFTWTWPGELRNPKNGELIFEKFPNLNIVYYIDESSFDENENFFIKKAGLRSLDDNEIISLRKDYFRSRIKKSNLKNNILTLLDENNVIGVFELSKSCSKLSEFKTNLLKCSKEMSFDKEKKEGFCDTQVTCEN